MITSARRCPDCKRVLFPTRDGLWPRHYTTLHGDRTWCTNSDNPVIRVRSGHHA